MTSNQEQEIPCPDRFELDAFAAGDLANSRLEQMAEHIDACQACGVVVDSLSGRQDSGLVAELRSMDIQPTDLGSENSSHDYEVPETLFRAACSAAAAPTAPASFDAGRRLANRLENGPVRLG